MCKRFLLCFGTFLLSGIICALCFVGVDASAEDELKLSASDCRAIWGDSLPCSYSYANVDYTGSFTYSGVLSGSTGDLRGINIENNSIIGSSSWSDYTILVYTLHTNLGSVHSIRNLHIDFVLNYDTYIRGCFGIGTWATVSNVACSENLISSFPDNKFGNVSTLSANSSASSNFANYYNVASCSTLSGSQYDFRLLPYEFAGGGVFSDGIYWDSVFSSSSGDVLFLLFTPIVRGSVSADISVTTTSPVTTAPSSGGQTIINYNADLTETHSILGGISNFLQSIWDSIRSIPQSILNGIQSIFVPEDGYFDSKVAQVKAKFSWYEDIVDAWTEFKTALNGISADTPPSITLSLDNRTFFGRPIGSGTGTALVLDWMYTYRNTIRNLLSAFMWIFFIWRIYCHIPNIISGSGMEVQKTDEGAAWTIHGHKL